MKIDIQVREHDGYKEWDSALKRGADLRQLFGRHQFLYEYKGNIISLVELKDILNDQWFWEIHCNKGNLFRDCERFEGKQLAENRIILLFKDVKQGGPE